MIAIWPPFPSDHLHEREGGSLLWLMSEQELYKHWSMCFSNLMAVHWSLHLILCGCCLVCFVAESSEEFVELSLAEWGRGWMCDCSIMCSTECSTISGTYILYTLHMCRRECRGEGRMVLLLMSWVICCWHCPILLPAHIQPLFIRDQTHTLYCSPCVQVAQSAKPRHYPCLCWLNQFPFLKPTNFLRISATSESFSWKGKMSPSS